MRPRVLAVVKYFVTSKWIDSKQWPRTPTFITPTDSKHKWWQRPASKWTLGIRDVPKIPHKVVAASDRRTHESWNNWLSATIPLIQRKKQQPIDGFQRDFPERWEFLRGANVSVSHARGSAQPGHCKCRPCISFEQHRPILFLRVTTSSACSSSSKNVWVATLRIQRRSSCKSGQSGFVGVWRTRTFSQCRKMHSRSSCCALKVPNMAWRSPPGVWPYTRSLSSMSA